MLRQLKSDSRMLLALLSACAFMQCPDSRAGDIAVQDGQKIAFLGDSITQAGWGSPGGYVRLVISGLEANGIKAAPVPAGISGHKSNQMLERLSRDVISKQPDWMTLSCGVNDVWHGKNGVPLDQYKTNITAIIDQAQAANIKVMILTATVIGEELENENNLKLAPYNDFLRTLATEKKCLLADLNATFQTKLKASAKPGRVFTSDGVHMNPAGDQLMATDILKSFGLDEAQLQKAHNAWLDIPGGASVRVSYEGSPKKILKASAKITLRQSEKLQALAAPYNKSVDELARAFYAEQVKALLKPGGKFETYDAIFESKQEKEVQATLQQKLDQHITALLAK